MLVLIKKELSLS